MHEENIRQLVDEDALAIFDQIANLMHGAPSKKRLESLLYVAKCLASTTPSHEVHIGGLSRIPTLYAALPLADQEKFGSEIAGALEKVAGKMHARGYRTKIYTWQEERIFGSTTEARCETQPYTPVGIIDGTLSVNEASVARKLERCWKAYGEYFNSDAFQVTISLEPLNPDGTTVRDPQLLDDHLNYLPTTYSADFPARRP